MLGQALSTSAAAGLARGYFLTVLICCSLVFALSEPAASEQDFDSPSTDLGLALDEIPSHPLGPGDVIEIRVIGDESASRILSGRFVVEPNGSIEYPLVGRLQTANATPGNVALMLHAALKRHVPISGVPFVRIAEYAPVFLVGDVVRSGSYPYRPGMKVLDLVLQAGGLQDPEYRASAIANTRQEIEDLEAVLSSLRAQRGRLRAALRNEEFTGSEMVNHLTAKAIVESEVSLFDARRRQMSSQVSIFKARQQTYEQEILSLTETIDLHDEEVALVQSRFANQERLAERGLLPASQLLDAKRELVSMERQKLELRTALFRAKQGRLEVEQQLADAQIGTEVRTWESLSEIELAIVRNTSRLGLLRERLFFGEAYQRGGETVAHMQAHFAIMRPSEGGYKSILGQESTSLSRGDILRVTLRPAGAQPHMHMQEGSAVSPKSVRHSLRGD